LTELEEYHDEVEKLKGQVKGMKSDVAAKSELEKELV
jgi:hypothetical protein